MNEYNKITAHYSRLSVGDEDRDGGESNSIVNQKAFLERYAQQQRLTNIRHYIDDDESGRFFDLAQLCQHGRALGFLRLSDLFPGVIQSVLPSASRVPLSVL